MSLRPATLGVAVVSSLLVALPLAAVTSGADAAPGAAAAVPAVTDTPTDTATPTPTDTATPTVTPTPTDTPTTPPPPPPSGPVQGAAGLGDRLFPTLGNGGYNVKSYDLSLRYATKKPSQAIVGTVVIKATATEWLSRFDLDFAGKTAGTVTVNGKKAKSSRPGQELRITPAKPILSGAAFTVTVKGFTAKPTKPGKTDASRAFFVTKEGSVLAGEPDASHYLYPSNDHPSDKASYTFHIDVPKGETAVTNGVLKSKHSTKTRTTWTYSQSQPMAPELTQVAVGNYTVLTRKSVGKVKIRDVVATSKLKMFKTSLAPEGTDLAWLVKKVGAYPFSNYGSLVVNTPQTIQIESQTLPLYDSDSFAYSNLKTKAEPHSYWAPTSVRGQAYQWFGDSVSPKTWSDVWLNEGLASWFELTYADAHHTLAQDFNGDFANLAAIMEAIYGYGDEDRADDGPVALPDSASVMYGADTSDGGALTLYALRQQIGSTAFNKVISAWASTYQGKSASTANFIALASKVSGQDLSGFLTDWLYGTTTPPMPGHSDWTANQATSAATASIAGPALLRPRSVLHAARP